MSSEHDKPVNPPLPGWQAEEWVAARPYYRGMVGSIAVTVLLGLAHLFVGLPTAVYFGLGIPLLFIYYQCLTRLKRLVGQVQTKWAQRR